MAKINDLIRELTLLRPEESRIIDKVWENSGFAYENDGAALDEKTIQKRVTELAKQIAKDCQGTPPVLVGLLDGATPFATMLCAALEALNQSYDYSPMQVGSYGKETESGALTMGPLPKEKLYGRKTYIVDDVCDTGKTLLAIKNAFAKQYPEFVKMVALVEKDLVLNDADRKLPEKVCSSDYHGFRMPKSAFLIGFGMDFRGKLRDETSIRVANLSVLTAEDKSVFTRIDELEVLIENEIKRLNTQEKLKAPVENSLFATTASTSTVPAALLMTPCPSPSHSDSE